MLIDSHCHIDFPVFDADRMQVLQRCQNSNIQALVIPGVRAKTWQRLITINEQVNSSLHCYYALGLHPYFLAQHSFSDIDKLQEACQIYHPVAIGEIGLDYLLPDSEYSYTLQKQLFIAQLKIAAQQNLAVIIHARKAHDDILWCLHRYPVKGGVIHAFNGSMQQAKRYQAMQFKLGFGGTISYPKARKIRYLVQHLPLSQLLLETDAPDMSPIQYSKLRNSPEYLPIIWHTLLALRKEKTDEIQQQLLHNAKVLFNVSE